MASTTRDAYPTARLAAPKIYAHFASHIAEAQRQGHDGLAVLPDTRALEEIIDAAFWTSLLKEEGRVITISLAYLSPDQSHDPLIFERPLSLNPAVLTKVAPAVERPGIHLAVWPALSEPPYAGRVEGPALSEPPSAGRVEGPTGRTLQVWGATRSIPTYCFVLEVAAPGLLVIKHHRLGDSGKFVNVAVLEADRIKLVDEAAPGVPDCPAFLTSLIRFSRASRRMDAVELLIQLAVSMRGHRRGGSLLVVPAGEESWRESIVNPIHYALSPPFKQLATLLRQPDFSGGLHTRQDELARAVDAVAGLTAVDGAAIMSSDYEVLAFGAKIMRRRGSPPIEQVMITEPVEDGVALLADPEQLGGTRHLSAAQFVQDQPNAIALVASQDGRFTVFAWSPQRNCVHAHRIESLLL